MHLSRYRRITGLFVVVLALPSVTACKKQDIKEEARPVTGDSAGGGTDDAGAARGTPEVDRKPALIPQAQVQELMDRWLAAQNESDFSAYSALYGEDFGGVRRSGKRAVRLDRAGWLEDRRRMFKNTMTVTIRDVEIAVGPKGARVHFTQEWASGKYHDIGPKVIVVKKTAHGLRIVREEMLSSLIVGTTNELPPASDRLALVYDGMVVLDSNADPAWATGKPELLRGIMVEQDPECESDPPDYEAEHSRYWECSNSHPSNAHDHFVASHAVDARSVPAEIAAWQGKKLALYGAAGRVCEAQAGDFLLWGERKTTMAGLAATGNEDHEVAAAVLEGNAILTTKIAGTCKGAVFARSAALPPPPQWTLATPDAALAAAVERAFADVYGYDEIQNGAANIGMSPPPKPTLLAVNPPGKGRRFVVGWLAGALNCHEDGFVLGVWEVKGSRARPVLEHVFDESNRPIEVLAAADFTGQGVPVLVLDDGYLVWGEDSYAHVQVASFPEQVMNPCHCECE
jgi:ketosteroid isomerase-like protein